MRNFFTPLNKFNNKRVRLLRGDAKAITDTPISITFIGSLQARVKTHEPVAPSRAIDRSGREQGGFVLSLLLCHLQFHKVPKRGASCFLFNSSLTLGLI